MSDDSALRNFSDAELIDRVRAGDDDAYGVLYARHSAPALHVAARMTRGTPLSADDAVADAFLNVLTTIRAGSGPTDSFRAYLYTVVRNGVMAARERDGHLVSVASPEDLETADDAPDPIAGAFESGVVARAFATLPERWQAVLWYHEVEGMKPGAIAPLLGLGANATSALLVRAREGLREAYLAAHVEAADRPECRWTAERMGAAARGSLSRRDRRRFEAHLDDCDDCPAMFAEVTDVARGLRVVVAPLVLGGGVAGWLIRQTAPSAGGASGPSAAASAASPSRAWLVVGAGSLAATAIAVVAVAAIAMTSTRDAPREGSVPVDTTPVLPVDPSPSTPDPIPLPEPTTPPEPTAPEPPATPPRSQPPVQPPDDGGGGPVITPNPSEIPDGVTRSDVVGGVTVIDAAHPELTVPTPVQSATISWVSDQVLSRDLVLLDTPGGSFALDAETVETYDMPDGSTRYVSTADATAMVQGVGAGTWTMSDALPVVDWQLTVSFAGADVSGVIFDGTFELQPGQTLTLPLGRPGPGTARVVTLDGAAPTATVIGDTLVLSATEYVAVRRILVIFGS